MTDHNVNTLPLLDVYNDDGSSGSKMSVPELNIPASSETVNGNKPGYTPNWFKFHRAPDNSKECQFEVVLEPGTRPVRIMHSPTAVDAIKTNDSSFQYDYRCVLAVHTALHEMGVPTDRDLHLHVTLPVSDFFDENNNKNIVNVERKRKVLLESNVSIIGERKLHSIKKVSVYPESVTVAATALQHLVIDELDHTAVYDIGFTTTDEVIISGQFTGIHASKGHAFGMSIAYENLKSVCDRYHLPNSQGYVMTIFESLMPTHENPTPDESRAQRQLKNAFVEFKQVAIDSQIEVANKICELINARKPLMRVVLTGGGSLNVYNHVVTAMSEYFMDGDIIIPSDPQRALVESIALNYHIKKRSEQKALEEKKLAEARALIDSSENLTS
ncbi:hypothetical protein EIJ81_00600 (plasmid) [Aliivibrio salmonicida]|uniref:plasmid segregation protein ParM domain-containing protein n=1 Tax=Aliivibrio salmonicida TaxID=40269 RepID=UPI000F6E7946|nr:plasmid segregation protein ParM domain-containing protein [Aliivibrio salmonicida]AZL83398.1 hypothetical protein EIJ81_00600 [Aliivibrio salmonicida]